MKKLWLRDVYCATPRRWQQICFFLTGLFVISAYLRISASPSGPGLARQTEQIGKGLRFAEEFRARGYAAFDFLLHPLPLSTGITSGTNLGEFPLLSLLSGLFHAGTLDPWIGVFLTCAFLLALNLYVAYVELPKLLAAWGAQIAKPFCLLLWLGSAAIASNLGVVLADGFALPLAALGIARILANDKKFAAPLGILALNVAIATSPALCLTIALVGLAAFFRADLRPRRPALLAASALSLSLPLWWYFVHAPGAAFTSAHIPNGLGLSGLAHVLWRELHVSQFPIYLGLPIILIGFYLREWLVLALFAAALGLSAASTSLSGALQGMPLAGATLFAVLALARILGATSGHKFLRPILLACLVWGSLYSVRTNIWVAGRASQHGKISPWDFARAARPEIPVSYRLITDDASQPTKLMLLGRSGASEGSAVFTACNEAAYASLPLALVSDSPPPLGQVLCGGRPREIRHVIASGMKWYITLLPAPAL
ncbi:MAG: hypothetical protein EOP11_19795 [Proteobacteria bacterium]|nr:MAG: hypothetical protein EOP11_19795 [Pseudomonadota bacterium]